MKPITKVFLVIGALLACFLVWELVFNDAGIIRTGYAAIADSVNGTWQDITGTDTNIIPEEILSEETLDEGNQVD